MPAEHTQTGGSQQKLEERLTAEPGLVHSPPAVSSTPGPPLSPAVAVTRRRHPTNTHTTNPFPHPLALSTQIPKRTRGGTCERRMAIWSSVSERASGRDPHRASRRSDPDKTIQIYSLFMIGRAPAYSYS